MSRAIVGDGTPGNPLRPGNRVRGILKALKVNPRATMTDIRAAIETAGGTNNNAIKRDLLDRGGAIGDLVRWRIRLAPNRHSVSHGGNAGTCLIGVIAEPHTRELVDSFEECLANTDRIIEWDEILGNADNNIADYIIRVAGIGSSPEVDEVQRKLEEHPRVFNTFCLALRRSRIVDRFEPDDFLCIEDDQMPLPSRKESPE